MKEDLIKYFESFISPNRIKLINDILPKRTRYVTIVLEDINQPHNASAILRTCEGLGIQDIHIIENQNKFKPSHEIALGTEQWLNIYKYNQKENNTLHAIHYLKENGYRIIATSSNITGKTLDKFNLFHGRAAFVFGSELNGISNEIKGAADEFLKIPMFGFAESYNISVSAAIVLHHVSWKLRRSKINWKISDDELNDIRLNWLKSSIKKPELIEKHFLQNIFQKKI